MPLKCINIVGAVSPCIKDRWVFGRKSRSGRSGTEFKNRGGVPQLRGDRAKLTNCPPFYRRIWRTRSGSEERNGRLYVPKCAHNTAFDFAHLASWAEPYVDIGTNSETLSKTAISCCDLKSY